MSINQTCQSDLHEQTYTYTTHKNVLHYILSSESNRGRFLCVVVVFLCLEYLNLTYLLTYNSKKNRHTIIYYECVEMSDEFVFLRHSVKYFVPGVVVSGRLAACPLVNDDALYAMFQTLVSLLDSVLRG